MKAEERTDFLDRDKLRRYFEQGCKPSSEWGIGSEYENFIFTCDMNWVVNSNSGIMFRAKLKGENQVYGPQAEM